MIEVERVNGVHVFLNPDLIKYIERTPDTVVTFLSGEKMLLKNSPEQIIDLIIQFRRLVHLPEVKG